MEAIHSPLQVPIWWLFPQRIALGIVLASLYETVGGFWHPWAQALGVQFCTFWISICMDVRYRSIYRKLRAEEAAAATADCKAAASKLQGLLADSPAASPPQVGGQQAVCITCLPRPTAHSKARGALAQHTRVPAKVAKMIGAAASSKGASNQLLCSPPFSLLQAVLPSCKESPQQLTHQLQPQQEAVAAWHAPFLPYYPINTPDIGMEKLTAKLAYQVEQRAKALCRCVGDAQIAILS